MKSIRISKANHHSKNGLSIVADMYIALLIAEKSIQSTLIDLKNTENQANLFYHYLKKIKVYQTKFFKVTIAQKNYFQIAIAIANYKPPIEIPFAKDHQIDEIRKTFHENI